MAENEINDALKSEKEKLLAEIKNHYSGVEDDNQDNISSEQNDNTEGSELSKDNPSGAGDMNLDAEETNDGPIVMKAAEPLPKYGKGFIFVPISIGVTILAILLGHIKPITSGIPSATWLRYTYIAFGAVLIFFGIKLIVDALSACSINENLQMGRLVTTGIYNKTRNPVYAGVLMLCTAALFISGNAFMYIFPIALYFFLKILMEKTEELLLEERFGDTYREYRSKTYMFFPIPKK